MTVFEGGALGRYLGPEGGALLNGISALTKEAPESSRAPSTSEDTGGAGDPKEGPHLTVLAPRFQTRSFRNCEQSISVLISRLVCAVLLQEAKAGFAGGRVDLCSSCAGSLWLSLLLTLLLSKIFL